jgi:hypothetical protein
MSGPDLPVIYENPRFDKATPTLWPVFDRATRFTLVILMEWGTLTLIEDAPRYVKFATVIVAALGLAVHESWPWLRMRDWRWYPSLMLTLVVGYLALFSYALYTEPGHKAAQQPMIGGMFNEAMPRPPEPPRSRQAINELLDESGSILSVIEKSGLPLINEWRESITTQNPERICLDVDSRTLQDKITALANKLIAAHTEISNIYEKNRIDQAEFNKVFGSPIAGAGPAGFAVAAQPLQQFAHEINLLGEHPTCEVLIRSGNIPTMVVNMSRGLDQFSIWVAQSQENLSRYRDNLRKELRNAP